MPQMHVRQLSRDMQMTTQAWLRIMAQHVVADLLHACNSCRHMQTCTLGAAETCCMKTWKHTRALAQAANVGTGLRRVGGDTPHRPTQVAPRHTSDPARTHTNTYRPPLPRAAGGQSWGHRERVTTSCARLAPNANLTRSLAAYRSRATTRSGTQASLARFPFSPGN